MTNDFVRGMPTGLFVSEPAPYGQQFADSNAVRINVQTYTPSGSASVPVRLVTGQGTSGLSLPAGSVIAVATITFQVAADVEVRTNTTRDIEVVGGLPISLSAGAQLWATESARLYRVHGTSDTDVEISASTQDATSAISDTHGATWSAPVITGRSWRLPRRGRFRPADPAYQAVRAAALHDSVIYVRRVLPDENGDPGQAEGGWAIITSFSNPAPADGIVDASWVFQGVGALDDGAAAAQPDLSGVMLDFSKSSNAINLGFA